MEIVDEKQCSKNINMHGDQFLQEKIVKIYLIERF